MIQWKRTRFVLSIALIAVVLLLQAASLVAQAEKFQENMQKGDTALNQRNFEAAITAYKNAVKDARSLTGAALATASAQANLGLSRAYLGLGAFKNAIQSCDEALRHTGTNTVIESMVRNQKGLAIVSSVTKPGDPNLEKAITEFRRVLEITDQDPIVSYNLGVTLLKLNKDAEGVHELQAFVARVGNTPEAITSRRLISEPRRARENFAPDFSVTTLDGEFVTLEDLKGKVVLLDFWGTWCPPCRESTPSLVRYSKRHPSEVFAIIGVAVNEPSDQGWRDYIEKNKMTWPQYIDSSRKIAALFKVNAYPTYITIDADGIIRDRRTGWNAETMSYIDDHVRKAVKAREKAGPPVLKTPDRPTPVSTVPTTQANPTPVQPAPRIEPLSPIPVAGIVGGVSAPATPPPPVNTITSGGVSVRGRVTRLPGAQAALRANLILPGPQPVTTSTVVGPDGSFEFVNVRPGNYNVTLSVPVPFRSIVVGSLDMTGIEFTVPPMRPVLGRVVIEGGGSLPQRLTLLVPHQIGSLTMSVLIQPDGTFNVLLPEGERRLSLNAPGYSVRSFTHGSTELLRDSFKLSNTDTSQLLVTLTPGGPTTPPSLPLAGPRGTPGAATLPVALSRVEPQYTDQARQAQLQGAVRVQAIIRKDGTMDAVQVLQGLGMGLDEAAVAAVKQWRFRPATRDGEPIDYQITLTLTFNLRQ